MDANNLVPMGYVKQATGIKGWIKIKADTEFADGLMDYQRWFLGRNGNWQEYTPESGKLAPDGFQAKLVGIDDRTSAETLKGMTIAVLREDFAATDDDEYYWTDLVGLTVKNPQGEILGVVSGLQESGAHDILVVKGAEKQILIPFVAQFILTVNLSEKLII
ncbi:MAG: ribosome maturation factor RimM, partial [Neisseriaceae bacterium]|nr:ribosome maturation factor RimM [Neisseriaceae bacterium]